MMTGKVKNHKFVVLYQKPGYQKVNIISKFRIHKVCTKSNYNTYFMKLVSLGQKIFVGMQNKRHVFVQ